MYMYVDKFNPDPHQINHQNLKKIGNEYYLD